MNVFNRRWFFRISVGLLGALLAIQLVPYGRNHSNPPVTSEPHWDSPATRALARQAADRDRLAQGLAKTLGGAPHHEARERGER